MVALDWAGARPRSYPDTSNKTKMTKETMSEPELISIIEGPTPDFLTNGHGSLQSIYEGPIEMATAVCELRTNTGPAIIDRCTAAWREQRLVKLEFPDEARMPQLIDVISMQLRERDEGEILMLWVASPVEPYFLNREDSEEFDDFDDMDFDDFDFDDDILL